MVISISHFDKFLPEEILGDFFILYMIFIIGVFNSSLKIAFYKNRPKFGRHAIILFQMISRNTLKTFTFWQKSFEFCIPRLKTPQPVLP